jgi:hypothetical protein
VTVCATLPARSCPYGEARLKIILKDDQDLEEFMKIFTSVTIAHIAY